MFSIIKLWIVSNLLIKSGSAYISYTSPELDGCDPMVYRVLDDDRRSTQYSVSTSLDLENSNSIADDLLCDDVLPFGWYRFLSYGMSRDMATSCPDPGGCGTQAPVWLDPSSFNETQLMSKIGHSVTADACVSWSFAGDENDSMYESTHDCCLFTLPVIIKNCGTFRVYHLGPTQACSIAYCISPGSTSPQNNPPKTTYSTAMMDYYDEFEPIRRMIPTVKLVLISPMALKPSYALKCQHDCDNCSLNWYRTSRKTGQRSRIIWTDNLLPLNTHKFQIGDDIMCDISAVRNGKTLFAEISAPFETGIVIDAQKSLSFEKNGQIYVIAFKQMIPINCFESNCKLEVQIEDSNGKQSGPMMRNLKFSSCSVKFDKPDRCSSPLSSNFCNLASVNITVTEDFSSSFDISHGQLNFNFVTDGDSTWIGIEGLSLNYSISNLPTSQCHIFTEPHVITFDQHRYDFYGTGTFLLHQNIQDDFEVHVRFWDCNSKNIQPGLASCACGVIVKDRNDVARIDMCEFKTQNGSYSLKGIPISIEGFSVAPSKAFQGKFLSGREGTFLVVELASKRFLRIEVEMWGISLSLQGIGADFRQSRGLCGNFDGSPVNDFHLDYFSNERSEITSQDAIEFVEKWRFIPPESFFDSIPNGPDYNVIESQRKMECNCDSRFPGKSDCQPHRHPSPILTFTIDITEKIVNSPRSPKSGLYTFDGDLVDHGQHEMERYLTYPTPSGLSEEEVFQICTDAIVNSSIAKACGRFFDRDIMQAVDICVMDVTLMDNPSWSKFSLPLVEAQCNAAIWRQTSKWLSKNGNGNLNLPSDIIKVLNCPNDCSDRGICDGKKCVCQDGFRGPSCNDIINPNENTNLYKIKTSISPDVEISPELCDLKFSETNCTLLTIQGENLVQSPNEKGFCEIVNLSNKQLHRTPFSYVSHSKLVCVLPSEWITKNNFSDHHMTLKVHVVFNTRTDLLMLEASIYNSDCHECDFNSGTAPTCKSLQDVCKADGRCFKDEMTHPKDKCLTCRKGLWINDFMKAEPEVNSTLKMKFTLLIGDTFIYRLPIASEETTFKLINGPFGTILNEDRGVIEWKALSNLVQDKFSESFIIIAEGGCGVQTKVDLIVEVFRCQCQNGGQCRTDIIDSNGVPTCHCKKGFSGIKCEISDVCQPNKCFNGTCFPNDVGFTCHCNQNFVGRLCDIEVSQVCSETTCFTGVLCSSDSMGRPQCGPCPDGFSGDGFFCYPLENLCSSNPCFPDVDCFPTEDGFTCGSCPDNYFGNGVNCEEMNACNVKNPCFPGVECFPLGLEDFVCGACPQNMTGNGKSCKQLEASNFSDTCINDPKNPCFDRSMCKREKSGKISCIACPKGYKGDGISCKPVRRNATDLCSSRRNPCYPGSTCYVVNGIVACGPCPLGTTGDGKECHPEVKKNDKPDRQNFCKSNPCFHGVDCYNFKDRFKCGSCPSGFTGNGVKCTAVKDPCKPNPCFPGVSCITVWKGRQAHFACGLCPEGMIGNGERCVRTDPCESNPCRSGTVCISMHEKGTFECEPCSKGLIATGKVCRPPINLCESNPCYPGVTCSNEGESFKCGPCPIGTSGDGILCKDINDCNIDSCYLGVECLDFKAPLRGFQCGPCPASHTGNGRHCTPFDENQIIKCPNPSPCFSGVDCYSTSNRSFPSNITCGKCPEGYSGDGVKCKAKCFPKCDHSFQHCSAPNICKDLCFPPCQNGGRCSRSGKCRCREGFGGKVCDTPLSDDPSGFQSSRSLSAGYLPCLCQNSGTCLPTGKCLCPSGFIGDHCQQELDISEPFVSYLLSKSTIDPDLNLPPMCKRRCQNGGTCIKGQNRCKCSKGYKGRFCNKYKCSGGCGKHGKCVGPETCKCKKGYSGKNCKTPICSPECQNGGLCVRPNRCKCQPTFTGKFCQH